VSKCRRDLQAYIYIYIFEVGAFDPDVIKQVGAVKFKSMSNVLQWHGRFMKKDSQIEFVWWSSVLKLK